MRFVIPVVASWGNSTCSRSKQDRASTNVHVCR